MDFELVYDIDAKDYLYLRSQLGWKQINENQVKKAINNSMINISIFDGERCIGMGRIVGDNILKGMLTDIIIDKEYQGKGIGRLIVTTLIDEVRKKLDDGDLFQLEASPTYGNREFYVKCGMKYKPENQDGVYLWLSK